MVLRRQLRDVANAFAARRIPALVLKGAEFADRLYPRPDLRPFGDIDLLVPSDAVERAAAALVESGYAETPTPMKHAAGYAERTYRLQGPGAPTPHAGHAAQAIPAAQGTPAAPGLAANAGAVELHWNLVNSPTLRRGLSVAFEDLVQSEGRTLAPGESPLGTTPGGRPTLAPDKGPEGATSDAPAAMGNRQWAMGNGQFRLDASAMLLVAAVHAAASHAFDRLGPLCDIRQLVRGAAGPVEVERLRELIDRTGAGLAVATALELTGRIFGDEGPRAMVAALGLPRPRLLCSVLLTKGVVLRGHCPLDSFRRQAFRVLLSRRKVSTDYADFADKETTS
jgi:hypothetical protein